MKIKWNNLDIFHKSFIASIIYSLLAIGICSILLVVNNSFLYGAIIGSLLLLFSQLVIWVLWYKIPIIQTGMVKLTPLLSPLLRIIIYLTMFLLILFLVNDSYDGVEQFLYPINTIVLLIVYTITPLSYGTVIVLDIFLNRKQEVKK